MTLADRLRALEREGSDRELLRLAKAYFPEVLERLDAWQVAAYDGSLVDGDWGDLAPNADATLNRLAEALPEEGKS